MGQGLEGLAVELDGRWLKLNSRVGKKLTGARADSGAQGKSRQRERQWQRAGVCICVYGRGHAVFL